MARLYTDYCRHCKEKTTWVHHDLEPGRSDNCTKCGNTIWGAPKSKGKKKRK